LPLAEVEQWAADRTRQPSQEVTSGPHSTAYTSELIHSTAYTVELTHSTAYTAELTHSTAYTAELHDVYSRVDQTAACSTADSVASFKSKASSY
jgi:hypothetical protein